MSSPYPILNNRPIDQWKVTELKEELRKRRLTISGLKQELINRLNESIVQEELTNGSNPDPGHQNTPSGDHPDPLDGVQIEEDPVGIIDNKGVNIDSESTIINNDKSESVADDDHSNKSHIEELVTTTDLNVTVDEEVCPAVPMEINVVDSHRLQAQSEETGQFSAHDENNEEKKDEKSDQGVDEKIDEKNDEENDEKDKDTKLLTEDVNLNKTEPNNQVSEVKPDLGFPVNCESISTDSVSINEKNELKDNLNADNFHLELEVVKPEIVHQSSSDVAPIGGDLHPGHNVKGLGSNQGPSEGMDDPANASYEDLGKKDDSVDGGLDRGYPEKLNLDRSSGDESMEEDVLESKQIESNVNTEVVEDKVDVGEVNVEEPSVLVDDLSPPKKDAVAEDEKKPLVPAEKRKLEDKESHGSSEPLKRQRRWNTETLKVPEQQLANLTSSGTPTGFSQITPKRTFVRSDSSLSGDAQKERVVPPSQKPPTNSLRIDRFLRPFTLKAVQDMLSKTGKVCSFWMDNIKTHCYVMYSSEDEAVETRNAVYNLQWPPNGGRLLIAEFVDPQDVKMRLEGTPESPAPISPAAATPTSAQQNQTAQHPSRQHGPRQQLPLPPSLPPPPPLADPPKVKERLPPPPSSKKPEPPILTLDDLFMKTKFTPRIYYLPLSEEQVAAKKATLDKKQQGLDGVMLQ